MSNSVSRFSQNQRRGLSMARSVLQALGLLPPLPLPHHRKAPSLDGLKFAHFHSTKRGASFIGFS